MMYILSICQSDADRLAGSSSVAAEVRGLLLHVTCHMRTVCMPNRAFSFMLLPSETPGNTLPDNFSILVRMLVLRPCHARYHCAHGHWRQYVVPISMSCVSHMPATALPHRNNREAPKPGWKKLLTNITAVYGGRNRVVLHSYVGKSRLEECFNGKGTHGRQSRHVISILNLRAGSLCAAASLALSSELQRYKVW